MLNDLFFTYIKINFTYTNSLVNKYWYDNIKKYLKTKKIEFYNDYLYNIISNKCYYKSIGDNIFSNSYDNIMKKILNDILYDSILYSKIKDNIIEKYYRLINIYDKYDTIFYRIGHIVEKSVAEQYKQILYNIYKINIDDYKNT